MVLDDVTTTTLDTIFDSVFTSTGLAGMAAGGWIGDGAWTRSAGYADLAAQTPGTSRCSRPGPRCRTAKIVTELNPAVPSTAGAMISTLDDLRVWGNEIATSQFSFAVIKELYPAQFA